MRLSMTFISGLSKPPGHISYLRKRQGLLELMRLTQVPLKSVRGHSLVTGRGGLKNNGGGLQFYPDSDGEGYKISMCQMGRVTVFFLRIFFSRGFLKIDMEKPPGYCT